MKEIIKRLCNLDNSMSVKTIDELILNIEEIMNEIYEKEIKESHIHILTYHDLENYDVLMENMPAYDINFIDEKYIPYLQQHNSVTISFLNLTVLFYANLICNLIKNDVIKLNLETEQHLKSNNLSNFLFYYEFLNVVFNNNDEMIRDFYPYGFEYYLRDEDYNDIENILAEQYKSSLYSKVIDRILGMYRIRFSCVRFISEYNKFFIRVSNNYIHSLLKD